MTACAPSRPATGRHPAIAAAVARGHRPAPAGRRGWSPPGGCWARGARTVHRRCRRIPSDGDDGGADHRRRVGRRTHRCHGIPLAQCDCERLRCSRGPSLTGGGARARQPARGVLVGTQRAAGAGDRGPAPGARFVTAASEGYCYSTIKVLRSPRCSGRPRRPHAGATERERDLATRMITRSDNGATETLLAQVGRDEVERVAGLVGMTNTQIDSGGGASGEPSPATSRSWWMRCCPRSGARRGRRTTSSHAHGRRGAPATLGGLRPGVTQGPRGGQEAGALPDGYRLNSTGWVSGADRGYVLSILSRSTAGFSHGRRTVNEVADICHSAMADGLA